MQRGFSLMELMVVIAIMAILIGIAIPSYSRYTKRAHFTQALQAISPFKLAVTLCYQHSGDINSCSSGSHDIPSFKSSKTDSLINQITVENGIITLVPNSIKGFQPSDTYVLTPQVESNRISWKSSGGAVENGYAK